MSAIFKGIIIAALLLFIAGVAFRPTEQMTSIRITKTFPLPDPANPGKILRIDTSSLDYYFYNDFRAYQSTVPFYQQTDEGSILKSDETVYIVHHKDSMYARVYNSPVFENNNRIYLPAYESIALFADLQLSTLFKQLATKLIHTSANKDSGTLHEQYAFENKSDSSQHGVLFLSYTHAMNDIPFHLSPYMDSIKNYRVYRYQMIDYGGYNRECNFVWDTLRVTVLMERIPAPESNTLMNFINKYRDNK